jgi:hypothetical protein
VQAATNPADMELTMRLLEQQSLEAKPLHFAQVESEDEEEIVGSAPQAAATASSSGCQTNDGGTEDELEHYVVWDGSSTRKAGRGHTAVRLKLSNSITAPLDAGAISSIAVELKAKANACFQAGNLVNALRAYDQAIAACNEQDQDLLATLHSNKAHVLNKQGCHVEVRPTPMQACA